MNRFITMVFLFLLMCSFLPVSPAVSADKVHDIEITLERGMCFGTCPVYSVSLFGNGTIVWMGEMFVDVIGNRTEFIDPAMVADLYDQIIYGGFQDFADLYTHLNITDMPSATLTARNGTDMKQVFHYHGDYTAPENLTYMENAVDNVGNTSRWVGTHTPDEDTKENQIKFDVF